MDLIYNYILLNKSCLYIFQFNNEKLEVKELSALLDGILGPFNSSNVSEFDDGTLGYIKTLYPFYKKMEEPWMAQNAFIPLIRKIKSFKDMKIDYSLTVDNSFRKPDSKKCTIFDIFLNTCIRGARYLNELFYKNDIFTSVSQIIKEFLNNGFNYNPKILFKIDKKEDPQDLFYSDINAQSLIVNYLIKINEPKLFKYLNKLKWDSIEPKNYEEEGFHLTEKNEYKIWNLKSMKFKIQELNGNNQDSEEDDSEN